ncbi:putative Sodium/potassium/calcium exchanger Nckx30C [Cocos nucifera]|uniref:Putative Sodium/potassium/calcium exchanger Nckx30C n=1 Tax=Cocos nucifera TaxID=13894 RepID=A0A8K0IWC2_COCNU|nr:putative Sodium/potassium/calcium exchanger Nckx30C [Cocos nucifera]
MPSPPSLSSTKRLLHFFLLVLLVGSAVARNRHVITFGSPGLAPAGLAWDGTAQHFLVGSRLRPAVSSVSDAGVVEALVSDSLLPPDSSALALAVDNPRRRLLVAFARPATLAAYDLRSPRPHRRIFISSLPDPAAVPGGIAVDSTTGDAFVTSGTRNLMWKVDLDGNPIVFSKSPNYSPPESAGDEDRPEAATAAGGLGGVVHVSLGFLLAVQGSTGRVFKVDAERGAARAVTDVGVKKGLATEAEGVAIRSDGGGVVAGGRAFNKRWNN